MDVGAPRALLWSNPYVSGDYLDKGDAAALLLAVLALAAPTVNDKGLWELTDTAIGVVVGVIVIAFTHHLLATTSRLHLVAAGLTYASAATVALAWFAQRLFTQYHWRGASEETCADHATFVAAAIASLITVCVVVWYRRSKVSATVT
jgi:hypothetical protein